MFAVTLSIILNQPRELVFPYVTDFSNDAEWWPGVIEAKRVKGDEHGLGARYYQRVVLMGMRFEHYIDIVEFDPPHKSGFRAEGGLTPFSGTYTFEPVEGGTKLIADTIVEAEGVFKVFQPIFIPVLRRLTERNFASLKRVLDAKQWQTQV